MKHITVAAALLLLAACTSPVGPQESGVAAPSFWSRLTGSPAADAPLVPAADAAIEQQWWKRFNDPVLDSLIAEAVANNKTLQIARARVEEARARRGLAKSTLLPDVSGVAGASRGNQGYATNDRSIGVAEADVQASWELDLFGRNQALTAQATALLQSEEATQQGVMVGLLTEVARSYFDLRNAERQLVLTRQNLETQKKTAQLIDAQLQGALVSDFDVQRAQAQVSTTEALIPGLQIAYDAAQNRLNVLLGQAPGTKDAQLKAEAPLSPLDQRVLVAAPASVLAERPDVRAAERKFAASIAGSDAATRALFPTISLTGLYGVQGSDGLNANPWGIGANLVQPILNFGRIESQIDIADAQQKQAYLGYQQTVLLALEDMENALSSYLNENTRNVSLTRAVEQNRKAATLARTQYSNGYTGLLDVLVAERNALDAEASKAQSDFNLRKDLAGIYAAAGGGWRVE